MKTRGAVYDEAGKHLFDAEVDLDLDEGYGTVMAFPNHNMYWPGEHGQDPLVLKIPEGPTVRFIYRDPQVWNATVMEVSEA